MKNDRKISIKDMLIIILSILALGCLVFILVMAGKNKENEQAALNTAGSGNSGYTGETTEETADDLVIDEVCGAGWVELYNGGKENVDLSGMMISVGDQNVATIEAGITLAPQKLYTVDLEMNPAQEGENVITLYKQNGERETSLMVPQLSDAQSYGSIACDGNEKGMLVPTKGTDNSADGESVSNLTFSVPGGFYDDSFTLTLKAAEGDTIYYTTDGTTPTEESDVYKEPIEIDNRSGSSTLYAKEVMGNNYTPASVDSGTVVQAIAVSGDGTKSDIETQTYFVDIGSSKQYQNVAVLEITSDPTNLFDYYKGIYVAGRSREDALAKGENANSYANYYNEWVKPAHIEFYEADKSKTYEGDVKLQIAIDYTIASQQKSLLMQGDGAFAGSSLETYFDGESKTLSVETNQYDNGFKIRDYLASELLTDTDVGSADITPCIVFIDGEYWGCYMLKAPYDSAYLERHYGIKDQAVDIATIGQDYDTYYSLYNFIENNDMSKDENYQQLESVMDMQSYIDYLCANMYLGNAKFGTEGATLWRTKDKNGTGYADGKWRWLIGNMQNTMANGELGNVSTESIDTFLQPYFDQNAVIQSLLTNEKFRNQLSETMNQMAETEFEPTHVEQVLDNIAATNKILAVNNYQRFFGGTADNYYSSEVKKIQDFFDNREAYILNYTDEVVKEGGHPVENVDEQSLADAASSTNISNADSQTASSDE